MNKKNFFKNNPVGDLVEELKEQEMKGIQAGRHFWETSYFDSKGQAKHATLGGPGAFCTFSAECNQTKQC